MTESRAIELLEYIRETGNGEAPYVGCAQNIALNMAIQALEEVQQYRAIDTVEEFKALKEKSEPKNWIAEGIGYGEYTWKCPACNGYMALMVGTPKDNDYNFCPKCGQALVEREEGAG